MKVSLALVLAALTPAIMAANMKSVIVSFGSDAPDSVVQKAKDAITEAVRNPILTSIIYHPDSVLLPWMQATDYISFS